MKEINIQKASPRIGSVRDIRKNVLLKFLKVWKAMLVYVPLRGTNMAAGNQ